MTTTEKLITAEEFALLPEPLEGGKMELVEGRVVVAPPAFTGHGRRASRIDAMLRAFVEGHKLGELTGEGGYLLRTNPDVVRAPDAAFVAYERIPEGIPERGYVRGAPTLAVEIVSPGDVDEDVAQKVDDYIGSGAGRVWVVRQRQRTVTVHRPGGDAHTYTIDDTLTSDDAGFAVDGFALSLRDLFA